MKKVLFILLASMCVYSCKSQNNSKLVWTEKYESKIYKQVDDGVRPRLPDESRRRQFVSYIINRLKSELPNGVESIPIDSLSRLSMRIGKEYGLSHATGQNDSGLVPTAVPWSKELEQTCREGFLRGMTPEELKDGNKLCDCVLIKLKKIYPDSVIIPFPKDVILKVANDCHNEIK